MGTAPGRYRYTVGNARLYASLGIEGTTYQIGFEAVGELLGSAEGKVLFDFGCGAGRSAAFLTTLGAGHVYGVDHDRDMIGVAESRGLARVTFLHADGTIPLPDTSAGGAVSLNVFMEIRTPGEMRRACGEIARTLRPGGPSSWNRQARWRSVIRSAATPTRIPGPCAAATLRRAS